jgi:hypothetical protein
LRQRELVLTEPVDGQNRKLLEGAICPI